MNEGSEKKGRTGAESDWEALDPAMKQALGDFKASVRAWSEAEFGRQRVSRPALVHRTWRLALGWSLAGVLLAGTVSGGLYERHVSQVRAAEAAALAAQHERELAAQKAKEAAQQEEEMLASMDTAVSREVPSAMEPLAALGDETGTQQQQEQ